ncbi:MAG: hypothetical protein EP341_02105 [Sphingomonadales bacterium]|nr:MAG: hypothetical protein EP341_02105 [Sphingomonadales bacterium]
MSISQTTEPAGVSAKRSFEQRWAALHDAGQEIGALASLAAEPFDGKLESFPHDIIERGGARYTLARDGIEDMDAILQPGLTALRAIKARGQDTTAPALALWREFHALRAAILGLAAETESLVEIA